MFIYYYIYFLNFFKQFLGLALAKLFIILYKVSSFYI